ncbi:hydantoinase/oxoprolinase family protein [Rhodoligotrophos defluvii]|uniref:hydantoinase/oxoprolinase family protein n=1 Tax=Rhodoligotrophos defluvii TaxID=2561934 RepID=UPI0010CA0C7A|nr:hydantoinase/oxoprolinase family protein [Rhodoligotrophos defluvii]
MTQTFRVGIDVGGTFTDLVAIDDQGVTTFTKSPSTPEDQSIGVIAGLTDLAARLGMDLAALLGATDRIVHGTTVATNALLERKGAKVGLLTTEGHRDVIEMREGLKDERYNLLLPAPEPLVPRNLRRGVRERMAFDGRVLIPLDEASLDREIARLKQEKVTSVAVCYFHAYRNPAHEQRTLQVLAREMPDAYVSLSSDVLPQIKEYERVCTTVVNAYVGPAVRKYLGNLERRLAEHGFEGSLFIILSHGGIAPVEEAARLAAGTVLSGPAGGIAGARRCAELIGQGNLIPFDMGGTSTDISLIADGQIALSSERGLAGQRIALRSLDIISIGAGGGSLARVDDGGTFHVGPESAGAVPGPACYSNGGTEPAVTDANLLLGYLDPDNFLGGRRKLDRAAAEAAVDRLAAKLGLSRDETAAGIFRLINLKMADGIRLMTLRRGVDPRRFTLLSFGGAAGLHAVEVAREMEMTRVVVPTVASVLSAWGMLASDLRYEVTRSHIGDTAVLDSGKLREIFGELEQEAMRRLGSWFKGPIHIERSAEMRYGEQIFEVDVSLDGLDLSDPGLMDAVIERFHKRHEELYTYSSPGQEVVLVNARVAAVGEVPASLGVQRAAPATGPAKPARSRQAFFGSWREVPVYDLDTLAPGHTITGPAIIEAETTTVVLSTDDKADVNGFGWLDITLRARKGSEP